MEPGHKNKVERCCFTSTHLQKEPKIENNLFRTSLSLALGQPLAAATLAKLSLRRKTARESLSTVSAQFEELCVCRRQMRSATQNQDLRSKACKSQSDLAPRPGMVLHRLFSFPVPFCLSNVKQQRSTYSTDSPASSDDNSGTSRCRLSRMVSCRHRFRGIVSGSDRKRTHFRSPRFRTRNARFPHHS